MQGSRPPSPRTRVPYMLLAYVAAAWIAGTGSAALFAGDAWPMTIALAATLLAWACWRRSRAIAVYALVLPLIFAAGIVRERSSHDPLPADAFVHQNDGVAMRIRGVLREDPEISDTSQRFAVSVREIQRGGGWVDASGGVLVRAPLLPSHRSGDIVELEGKLETPPRLDDFDYAAYLARRGIQSVMEYPETRTIGHDDANVVRASLLRARRTLSEGLALALPEPQAALAQGVLLGERSALPADVREDLSTTNTSHLVVVSGGNIVLVSGFCTLLFGSFMRRRSAMVLSIGVVLAYAALVGFSLPVLRATIMGIVLITAGITGRRTSGITSILLAAALMIAWQPWAIRDLSFQLSFAATAGILYLATPLRRWMIDAVGWLTRRDTLPRWVNPLFAEPAAITVAATLATAPLLALNFERVSIVGLAANLLVVPAFPVILLSSLVAAVGGTLPGGHVLLGAPAHALLTYWLRVAEWLAALPAASSSAGGFTTPWAIASYAAAIAFAAWFRRGASLGGLTQLAPSRPMRWRVAARRTLYVAPAALVLFAGIGWLTSGSPNDARLQVTVLDVGQGDAILIETPSGGDVLIDGGPGRAVLRGLGEELAWHDRSIDLVVVTHTDADHATGVVDVLARYDVESVVVEGDPDGSLAGRALMRAALREDAGPRRVIAGTSFELGDGVRLEVISPSSADLADNDASLALRLTWREVSFLLAADIEAAAEQALLESGIDLRATVLKVAHHGSKTSSTPAFVDAVQPSVAVISAGESNHYGHPDAGVVGRLDAYADLYNTAADGAVRFETDGRRLWVDTDR